MKFALWFVIVQAVACFGASVGFFIMKQPIMGGIQLFYGAANVGWTLLALGHK